MPKKLSYFNIIWKSHLSFDSATPQQYSWASCGLVQFPGNLCVPWCLAWEKSHHKHQRGSLLAWGLWHGCSEHSSPPSFTCTGTCQLLSWGAPFCRGSGWALTWAAPREPAEQRDPLWSWAWAGGWKHSLTVVQRGRPDYSEPGWWKGRASTGARDGRAAPESCLSREQTCSQGKNHV